MTQAARGAEEALSLVWATPPRQGDSMMGMPFEKRDQVRFGFVGIGGRGFGQLREMLAVEGALVTAVSDVVPDHMERSRARVVEAGQPSPAVEPDWRRLCEREASHGGEETQ